MDSPTSKPTCDAAAAIERLDGDVELYKDLLYALFQGASGQLDALRRAVSEANGAAIHYSSHALKGLAATCGAEVVAERAHDLEDLGRADDLQSTAEALADLEQALQTAERELATYLDRGEITR